jgi:hypothetical protein
LNPKPAGVGSHRILYLIGEPVSVNVTDKDGSRWQIGGAPVGLNAGVGEEAAATTVALTTLLKALLLPLITFLL